MHILIYKQIALSCKPIGAFALLMGLGFAGFAASQAANPAAKQASNLQELPDPFTTLNDASRIAYKFAKDEALAKAGPVIFVDGDDLVLKNGAERTKVRVIPDVYHVLKTISHVPLAIDVTLLTHEDDHPLTDDVLKDLRDYRDLLPPVIEKLGSTSLSGEDRERAKSALGECMDFLDSVVQKRDCSQSERVAFARRMWPMMTMNAESAARAALDSLHQQVGLWKGQLSADEWSKLTVVVMGSQMPRKGNLAVQYFARLFGEAGEGKRIVYAEGLFDEQRAINLLATKLVDTRVGIDVFNEPLRLHRDLLSDAAEAYVSILIDRP